MTQFHAHLGFPFAFAEDQRLIFYFHSFKWSLDITINLRPRFFSGGDDLAKGRGEISGDLGRRRIFSICVDWVII